MIWQGGGHVVGQGAILGDVGIRNKHPPGCLTQHIASASATPVFVARCRTFRLACPQQHSSVAWRNASRFDCGQCETYGPQSDLRSSCSASATRPGMREPVCEQHVLALTEMQPDKEQLLELMHAAEEPITRHESQQKFRLATRSLWKLIGIESCENIVQSEPLLTNALRLTPAHTTVATGVSIVAVTSISAAAAASDRTLLAVSTQGYQLYGRQQQQDTVGRSHAAGWWEVKATREARPAHIRRQVLARDAPPRPAPAPCARCTSASSTTCIDAQGASRAARLPSLCR
eukprot:scaffold845_cov364-Prasinococcus_capsulatus_cf.AAC.15